MPATIPPLVDPFGRRIAYLRLSVTPYCNFRCSYCQPHGPVLPVGPRDEMTPAEIERLASAFVRLGVMKIRLTGGEPTLRRDLTEIVERLAALKADGLRDLSLSTHAMFLAPLAAPLKAAGLDRVNISLDTLDRERFTAIAGRDALDRVLDGIRAARAAGLDPIKLNTVPMRGVNDDEVGALLQLAADESLSLRFIELMPLEVAREFYDERHLGGEALMALLAEHGDWVEQERRLTDGPARRYRRAADGLVVGIIDPLSPNFCTNCNRVRITHRGELRNCLFGAENLALRPLLAEPDWQDAVEDALRRAILRKPEHHRLEQWDDGDLYSLVRVGG
ncbi:MAG: GTP 3',8-cyclase MoaA [Candidatus Krumholzibacteriia bacterium]|nr:GTP 3',8-cyclase MoaA [bacterium]